MMLDERFWAKVAVRGATECWLWTLSVDVRGYGIAVFEGKKYRAHRVAAYLRGIVLSPRAPSSMKDYGFVLHACDNPPCCNPAHLRAGTQRENTLDSVSRGRANRAKGETHPSAKLTAEQVQDIRERYACDEVSLRFLANMFGVSLRQIGRIVTRKKWQNPELLPSLTVY